MQKLMHVGASVSPIPNAHNLLLYADYPIFFFRSAIQQFQIFKLLLLVFQRITSLTLNMENSKLVLVNSNQQQNIQWATFFKYKVDQFPITYLRLPLSKITYKNTLHFINPKIS
jgi:hypothetical protein